MSWGGKQPRHKRPAGWGGRRDPVTRGIRRAGRDTQKVPRGGSPGLFKWLFGGGKGKGKGKGKGGGK